MTQIHSQTPAITSAQLAVEVQRTQAPTQAAPAERIAPTAASLNTGEKLTHTVRKGDTLWDIAGVKLGDSRKWPVLFALNKDQIKNPDRIYPGQVLTLPGQTPVAPTVPQPTLPNPVEGPPAPPPAPPAPVAEPILPTPAEPPAPPPVQEEPAPVVAPEPPATPPATTPIYLRPPHELPDPAPEPMVPSEPVSQEPVAPAQPEEPTQPAPIQEQPQPQPGLVTGPTKPETQSSGVGKAALVGGVIGTAGTAGALIAITSKLAPPLSNLGGYATAQVVAKSVNGVVGKVGLKVPTGPALTKIVSKVGGPKVAGAVTAVAVGAVVAGVAAGGYYLYNKATNKGEKPAEQPTQPTATQAPPAQAPQATGSAAPSVDLKLDIAPVATGEAPPAGVQPGPQSAGGQLQQLEATLQQKNWFGLGGVSQPEQVSKLAEEVWVNGSAADRAKLGATLVNSGQSAEMARILANQGVSDEEVVQVMSASSFPVSTFMNAIDDQKSTLILTSLANRAVAGDNKAAQLIDQTVTAYDRTFDREEPMKRLKNQLGVSGTWNALPDALRGRIDQLLK